MEENFSDLVHNFLNSIRSEKISEIKIKKLVNFVGKLNKGTEIQKRRFIAYYSMKNNNNKLENYSTIAAKEKCTFTAIKCSVIRIVSILVNLKDKEKETLIEIIKND